MIEKVSRPTLPPTPRGIEQEIPPTTPKKEGVLAKPASTNMQSVDPTPATAAVNSLVPDSAQSVAVDAEESPPTPKKLKQMTMQDFD